MEKEPTFLETLAALKREADAELARMSWKDLYKANTPEGEAWLADWAARMDRRMPAGKFMAMVQGIAADVATWGLPYDEAKRMLSEGVKDLFAKHSAP